MSKIRSLETNKVYEVFGSKEVTWQSNEWVDGTRKDVAKSRIFFLIYDPEYKIWRYVNSDVYVPSE